MTVETPAVENGRSQVMESIQGSLSAQRLLYELQGGCASPDALLEAVLAAGDGERLRGICRALQKAIEAKG